MQAQDARTSQKSPESVSLPQKLAVCRLCPEAAACLGASWKMLETNRTPQDWVHKGQNARALVGEAMSFAP